MVCALAALALVPTVIHSYAGFTVRDGRSTSAIPASLADYPSMPSDRNSTWGQRRFDSFDWTERNYTAGAATIRLTVVRSYDLKALYHHPELAVAYRTSLDREHVEVAASRPDVPIHVLPPASEGGPGAMYVLHYDDRFVSDPIRFQIRTAGELLFSGRKAMTLFFVTDPSGRTTADLRSPAGRILFGAIDSFLGDQALRP
jgi:hypothetical protein